MRLHTKCFNFSKLAIADGASTVARVAMVCNDLSVANSSLGHYRKMSGTMSHVGQGGALYFVRMSSGHLREGMKAVEEIKNHNRLSAFVARCAPHAQKAFAELCECLPCGRSRTEFKQYVLSVRDKTAFHYDLQEVDEALHYRGKNHSGSLCAMTLGDDLHSHRFEFADVLIDTIVCRKLWAIPLSANVRHEADRIADWCCTKSIEFLDFGGDFVTRFLREHA